MPDYIPPKTILPGRYYGTTRIVASSDLDPVLTARLVSFGRVLLGNLRNQMALAGVPVAARFVALPGGAVRVTSACGVNQIFVYGQPEMAGERPICMFYLESGLVQYTVPGIARILEDTVPGILYRADEDTIPYFKAEGKAVVLSRIPNHLELSPMPKNMTTSAAFGIPELEKVKPDPERVSAEKTALYSKIRCVNLMISSLYSGKLQLLIQAMYGDKTIAFKLSYQAADFDIPFLILDNYELHFEQEDSAGLWTDPDTLDYAIVRIKTSDHAVSVSARKLLLTECGKALRSYLLRLRKSDEWKNRLETAEWKLLEKKFEAYILKSARIDVVDLYSGSEVRIVGDPFSQHGWAFSWDGRQAHIVTHESISLGGGNSKRIARRYTVSVSRSSQLTELLALSAELSLSESVEYQIRPGTDLIWYYNYILAKMVTVVTGGNPTPFGTAAPIYCFYDNDNILRVVRYSYLSETLSAPAAGYEIVPDLYCYSVLGQLSNGEQVDLYWGTVITAGFHCDDVFDARKRSGQHEYHRTHTLTIEPDPIPVAPVYDGTNYLGTSSSAIPMQSFGTFGGFSVYPIQSGTWVIRAANFTDTLHVEAVDSVVSESLLVIPKNDVRSVYHGTYQIKTTPNISHRVLGGYRGWEQYFFIRPDPAVIGAVGIPFGGGGGYIYTANGGTVSDESSTSTRYLVTVDIVDRQPLSTEIVEIDSDDYYGGVGSWISFFDPPMLTDPTNDVILWVVHSLINDMTFAINGPTVDLQVSVAGDYPYFPTFSYVGWA